MGASSYWSTRNRSAPIPPCPQPIDQINVDLTPFRLQIVMNNLKALFQKYRNEVVVGVIVFLALVFRDLLA
jgi:hypothetical protein